MQFIYRYFKWSIRSLSDKIREGGAVSSGNGFSLTELLIVIVVIGILILMAYPEFSRVVVRAKETEAKIQLKHLYALQRSYYYENDRYTVSLDEIGFEQQKLVSDGGSARYKVQILQADVSGFRAVASSVVDYDKDGVFSEWQVNEKGEIKQSIAD